MWARGPQDVPQIKASTRWGEGSEAVADLAEHTPATRFVYLADREGDLRDRREAAGRRGTPADWLVRATHNRKTPAGNQVWDRVEQPPPVGEVEFMMPVAPG
jgi:hypothetical protein